MKRKVIVYRYRRVNGQLVRTPLTDPVLPELGEMIALPGKRDRRSRPTIKIGIDGKPLRPPLTKIRGRKPA